MQASIEYGEAVLDKIYTSFDYTSQVDITFIENHYEEEFRPHSEEPVEVWNMRVCIYVCVHVCVCMCVSTCACMCV